MWWFNTNIKLAVDNQNMYSFNWNIRSIKAHKLNLRLRAFEKSVEGKPKKATSLVVIEHVEKVEKESESDQASDQ